METGDEMARRIAIEPGSRFWGLTAVALSTVGSMLFWPLWLLAVIVVWVATGWTLRERLVATLVFPGGTAGAILFTYWMSALTAFSCSSGSSGMTDGLAGLPVAGSVHAIPVSCTQPSLPGWVGLALVAAALIASIVGPLWAHRHAVSRSVEVNAQQPTECGVGS
jgi:hypothetical protein